MKWLIVSLIFIIMFSSQQDDPYLEERLFMVQSQIRARGVKDEAVLAAMRTVPRHRFVPRDMVRYAYQDSPLAIGYEQTISQPYIVAYMTEVIRPEKSFRVLEIGTGSGYQAAVLAEVVDSVFTIEIVAGLGEEAKRRLQQMGYNNVVSKIDDGYKGWKEKGPFDAIVVTAAAAEIPLPLIEQLKENGRMIIPVGASFSTQKLVLVEKINGKTKTKNLMYVRFVPFIRPD